MPVAVVVQSSERRELKSLPEGYVVIKRMTYGQKLLRSELNMKMLIEMGGKGKADMQGEMKIMSRQVALWEFANLIEDHNLTDAEGRTLDFNRNVDVERIEGKIGEEISTYIDELNNFEKEVEDENLPSGSAAS
jgi:hypothetical protein